MKKLKEIKRIKEYRIYFLVFIYCGLIILFSNFITGEPSAALALTGKWNVSFKGSKIESTDAPIYYSGTDKNFHEGIYTLNYNLSLDPSFYKSLKRPVMVFPSVSGNGFSLKLNDQFVGSRGDMIRGEAAIWNIPHLFFIPENLLDERNKIEIGLYSLYEAGLNRVPYIIDAAGLSGIRVLLQLGLQYTLILLIGGLVILGVLFLVTGLYTEGSDIQKILLGLALFTVSVFLLDFTLINQIGFSYLVFKKIVVAAQYAALLFFILYISSLVGILKSWISVAISVFLGILMISACIYPGNMVNFRQFYQVAYVSNFVLYLYLTYLFLRKSVHSTEMIIIYSGGFSALLLSGHDIICLFLDGGQVFLGHYGILTLFLTGSVVIILNILNSYRESRQQTALAEQFYADSVRDPLTGVYNRKIIQAVEGGLKDRYSVLMFDLDDFKDINDNFGHKAGDIGLKAFVKAVNSTIRSNDYTIRMGGDEFVAILPGCSLETAIEQGEKIINKVAALELFVDGKQFSLSCTMGFAVGGPGESLSSVLSRADKVMYGNKKNQKQDGR